LPSFEAPCMPQEQLSNEQNVARSMEKKQKIALSIEDDKMSESIEDSNLLHTLTKTVAVEIKFEPTTRSRNSSRFELSSLDIGELQRCARLMLSITGPGIALVKLPCGCSLENDEMEKVATITQNDPKRKLWNNIFNHRDHLTEGSTKYDSPRAQLVYGSMPDSLKSVLGPKFDKIYEFLYALASENGDTSKPTYLSGSRELCQLLRSEAGCQQQPFHIDFGTKKCFTERCAEESFQKAFKEKNMPPASVIIAMFEDCHLVVELNSHTQWWCEKADAYEAVKLTIPIGYACIFRSDLVHAGAAYEESNTRAHMYIDHVDVPRADDFVTVLAEEE
jgi:hypothetical protein